MYYEKWILDKAFARMKSRGAFQPSGDRDRVKRDRLVIALFPPRYGEARKRGIGLSVIGTTRPE